MKTKSILAVSLVAIMAVSAARADIASTSYVTDRTGDTEKIAVSGAEDLTTAVNTLNTKLATVETTAGDAATKTYVDTELGKKADTATTLAGYGITDAYTKTAADAALSGKQENLTEAQLAAVDSGITAAKVTTYDGYATQITAAKNQADKGVSDAAAAKTAADGKLATVSQTGTGFVKTVEKDGTEVKVTAAALTADDIPDLTIAQITGLDTALSAKQAATTAVKFGGTAAVGSATQPVYVKSDGTVAAITSYSGTAAKATSDGDGNNIANTYVTKTALSTDLAGKQDKLTASNNITITKNETTGETTISATDTTYETGTATTAGLTKLYTGTGTNTDGTMTQNAIKTAVDAKLATDTYNTQIGTVNATNMGTSATTVVAAIKEVGAAAKAADDKAASATTAAEAAQTTANAAVVANAAIAPGTGTKITYDAKGLVTGSAALAASDIPNLTADKITNLGALATANPGSCGATATEKCVLTFDGTGFAWEKIGR